LKGVVLCGGSTGYWFSSLQTDSLRPDNTKNKELVKNELSEEELSDWEYAKISALGVVDAFASLILIKEELMVWGESKMQKEFFKKAQLRQLSEWMKMQH
jgi:hypothetical protein